MRTVSNWQDRLIVGAADGYFKAAIRRHPKDEICWSWALEWNESVRAVGFLGQPEVVHEVVQSLPQLNERPLETTDGKKLRFRTETPLDPEIDCLFS
jgi:hypothetical protein